MAGNQRLFAIFCEKIREEARKILLNWWTTSHNVHLFS
jgi:hypothetical protein